MLQHITSDGGRVSVESVIQGLRDELGPVLHPHDGFPTFDLDRTLGIIAEYVVEVDMYMQLDRIDWSVVWRHPDGAEYGFPFDTTQRDNGFGMVQNKRVHAGTPDERRKSQLTPRRAACMAF